MGYVIVGGVCLVVGAVIGIFLIALVSLNANTESVEQKPKDESEIYMGTCSLNSTHSTPEEVKQDADR